MLYLSRAIVYTRLGYPELAIGDAYRALLLLDDISDEGEYHDSAVLALRPWSGTSNLKAALADSTGGMMLELAVPDVGAAESDDETELDAELEDIIATAFLSAYRRLATNLLECGCLRSAATLCQRGLRLAPNDKDLLATRAETNAAAHERAGSSSDELIAIADLPDMGKARREIYPWNEHEPDRFAPDALSELNARLKKAAPKCEVRVAVLPILHEGSDESSPSSSSAPETCQQLGVFATEDIAPGEITLQEYSLITASNRLKHAVCDACSADLPDPDGGVTDGPEPVQCPECDVVFCSEECLGLAQERYHPAVCGKDDFDTIGKDPSPWEADSCLYLLLLARVLAIATHEEIHPLDVAEVKFLWGDFTTDPAVKALPFSFKYNITEPLHLLEAMDVDIFADAATHDFWVVNTLYSKFRGVASARKSIVPLGDGRPDVAAVHPLWCLANHDCDPNVSWEWGGNIAMTARTERKVAGVAPGLRKDEEVLNHYCDLDLDVKERREWARGPLGGDCMCRRCRLEANEI